MDGRAVNCGGGFDITEYPGSGAGAPGPEGPAGPPGYGVTGGGYNHILLETDVTATTSYEISVGKNALTAGPLALSPGVVITVPVGSTWTIV